LWDALYLIMINYDDMSWSFIYWITILSLLLFDITIDSDVYIVMYASFHIPILFPWMNG
jgi:hypothetical protein